jgi:hypothetical protein
LDAIVDLADHYQVLLGVDEHGEPSADEEFVVGQQDPQGLSVVHGHSGRCGAAGRVAVTVNRPSGPGLTSKGSAGRVSAFPHANQAAPGW